MYFKRLEIHGFKSFANPVTIEFDRGITCVVGPNGSGKSNICDAIRWVLGAQSAKALRGDKMEDVIFAGTDARRSRGMAEVTLVLDNSDQKLDIEYNEVAITRRMYRSGESEYLINNNRCRMKDIRELIMDTGIGVEGYSIIGQGKISDIISSNTDSIREILEETAGIVMYRSKKEEAQRKLSGANANMERVGDIIGELEGRRGSLKTESEKATKYLGLRDRHRHLEVNITLRHIEDLDLKNEYLKDDMMETEAELETLKERLEKAAAQLAEDEARRQELDLLTEKTHQDSEAVNREESELKNLLQLHEEKIASVGRDAKRLTEELQELAESVAREESNAASLEKERTEWSEKFEAADKAWQEKTQELAALSRRNEEESNSIEERKDAMIRLNREISECRRDVLGLEQLAETLEARHGELTAEQKGHEEGLRLAKEQREKAETEKAQAEAALEQAKQQLQAAESAYETSRKRVQDLRTEYEKIRIEIGKTGGRLHAMEEMEANYEGFNSAVRFVMKRSFPGIEGVVADLISVPKGYETAIETALGATMQNIVCTDDAAARDAIRALKEQRAGRATFLPMQSIRRREFRPNRDIEKAEGFCGYGCDCVSFDERYRTIAEYLLGNIVVAETMEDAIRMSKISRAFKFVTMDGEIINRSGAITGGKFKNKSAHIFERKSELSALKQSLDEMKRREVSVSEEAKAVRETAQQSEQEIHDGRVTVQEQQRDFFVKEGALQAVASQVSDSEEAGLRWQRDLDSVTQRLAEIAQEKTQLQEKEQKLTGELSELEVSLEKDIQAQEGAGKQLDSLREEITDLRVRRGEVKSKSDSLEVIAERSKSALAKYRDDIAAKQAQQRENGANSDELSNSLDDERQQLVVIQKKKETTDNYLKELSEEKQQLLADYRGAQTAKEGLDREHASLVDRKTELGIRAAKMETQLENARNKLWEEFEISYMQALDYKEEEFVLNAAVKENRELKKQIKELGEINLSSIEEYEAVNSRYEFLTEQRDDIVKSRDELLGIITEMDRVIHRKFKESFDQIVVNFEEVYRELYGGGHARIVLSDPSDPFASEIEITAQPPGKQLKSINLLSGGEKTMTAIALMFAVLKTKPTPCCVLDEIEAALDDSNLHIFGNYVRKFKGVQFTLITHQKATMEHADIMYGITMPESGVSKVYSLRME